MRELLQVHQFEEVVKQSRFLAISLPFADVEHLSAALNMHRHDHASHHCWAYRIGDAYRFSDDGEPGGTAGRPILSAINGADVDRVLLIVARWFGGIKLGAGGLVRAYGGAARRCLEQADMREIVALTTLQLHIAHADEHLLRHQLGLYQGVVRDQRYDAGGVQIRVELPAAVAPNFVAALNNALGGRIEMDD